MQAVIAANPRATTEAICRMCGITRQGAFRRRDLRRLLVAHTKKSRRLRSAVFRAAQQARRRRSRGARRAQLLRADARVTSAEAIALAERCGISRKRAEQRLLDFAEGRITTAQRDAINPRLGHVIPYRRETVLALLRLAGGSRTALAVYLGISQPSASILVRRLRLHDAVPRDRTVAPRCEVCGREYIPDPQPGKRAQRVCRLPGCRRTLTKQRFERWYANPENRAVHRARNNKRSPKVDAVLAHLGRGPATVLELAIAAFGSGKAAGGTSMLLRKLAADGAVEKVDDRWRLTQQRS